jgi:hypothetical protein
MSPGSPHSTADATSPNSSSDARCASNADDGHRRVHFAVPPTVTAPAGGDQADRQCDGGQADGPRPLPRRPTHLHR